MGRPKTNKPPRSKSQEAADRRNIARLYLSGMFQTEIASTLGISQSTVSRDIDYLISEWKTERVYDINEAKARELAKVDNLELEYWQEWRRSKNEAKTKRKKAVTLPEGSRKEQEEKTEERLGDPRYLQGVQWCIEQRCKILGVEAPKNNGEDERFTAPQVVEIIKHYEERREK